MKFRGSIIIIICCFLLQLSNFAQKRYTFSIRNNFNTIFVVCFQGLMFLVYPLLGHLADVYLTRYCILKCGLVILVIGLVIYAPIPVVIVYRVDKLVNKAVRNTIGCLLGVAIAIFEACIMSMKFTVEKKFYRWQDFWYYFSLQ